MFLLLCLAFNADCSAIETNPEFICPGAIERRGVDFKNYRFFLDYLPKLKVLSGNRNKSKSGKDCLPWASITTRPWRHDLPSNQGFLSFKGIDLKLYNYTFW